jgi:WD40 repeat protein
MRRFLPPVFLLVLLALAAAGQPKPPAFPAINPGIAKLGQTAKELPGPAVGLAFNEGKGLLVVGFEDGSLRLWTKEEGKELLSIDARGKPVKAHEKPITGVAAGGDLFATGSTDGKVLVWPVAVDKPRHTLAAGTRVRCLAMSPDGKALVCGGDDNAVQVWDPDAGKLLKKLTGPTDWVTAVALSGDGKLVAAGGHDGRLWAWERDSGKKLFDVLAQQPPPPNAKTAPETNVVGAIAFSPDGKQISLGGRDGKVYQFQAADGKFARALTGHTGAITGLAYHPGNAALVSAGKDRSLRLWNPQSGAALKTLEGHTAWVEGVVFFERGARLASAGADATVRVWELTPPAPPMPKKK